MAACPGPWGVLPKVCCAVSRFSAAARTKPARTPTENSEGRGLSTSRCAMKIFARAAGKGQDVRTVDAVKGAKVGIGMAEQTGWHVVGRKQAGRVVSMAATASAVREGTTGQLVTLPRVWAVAEGAVAKVREAGAEADGPNGKPEQRAMPKAELAFYRKYTEALLRRYVQMTMEAGRVPSMMGRSVLGGRASSYRIHGFDDAVNFRLDVERCLRRLEPEQGEVIRRVAMQEYTQAEAASLLGICLRTCVQRYGRSLDVLTGILLEVRLLEPFKGLSSGR